MKSNMIYFNKKVLNTLLDINIIKKLCLVYNGFKNEWICKKFFLN